MVADTRFTVPDEIVLERCDCPLGCLDGDQDVLHGRDRINDLPGDFQIVRCNQCGLMRTDPRPSPETIGYYYPSDYGPYLGTQVVARSALSLILRRIVRAVINFRTTLLPPLHPGNALEIGCASGSYMSQLKGMGWRVTGVEFSPTATKSARGLGFVVHEGALESMALPERAFDLVVGWMVLEHLHYPVEALRKLHEATVPGAWFVFSVPNSASRGFNYFGRHWFPIQLPNHLFHFTPTTLEKILSAGGWRMERCIQQRVLIDWPFSLALALSAENPESRIARLLMRLTGSRAGILFNLALYPFAVIAAALGEGSRMTVWARREDNPPC